MRTIASLLSALLFLSLGNAQDNSTSAAQLESITRLPVTRVILYKNGVGYFEHAGHVRGNQQVNVDFTTAQLNDVLKSLTILDLGKGRVTGVSYNSVAPLSRQLEALRLPIGENASAAQFIAALRGARLEVRNSSASATGRLLSVDQKELPGKNNSDDDPKVTVTDLSIVTDAGEVRTFDLTPATSVRITEKDLNEEVGRYLRLLASTRDKDVRRMTISTAGDGDRPLLVSYISEVPVWKCTYRIVVPPTGKPLLQGWAIVDNTVGEDWNNVDLSLVAGAPQSFVQELSQPYYTRRPVVPLPENAMITPQTLEATLEESAPVPIASASGVVGGVPGGVAGGVMGGAIAGVGNGALAGSGGGIGGGIYKGETIANIIESATTVGESKEMGDLFQYKMRDRVTIRKNQSALVPILQARIDAEKVSVWNPSDSYVLRALWVTNTSDLTLDGGSFNILDVDAFAGEGLMDPIKPGEKRLLSYAADLGLVVDAKEKPDNQRVTKIVISHGVMIQTREDREERTYTIHNRDISPRTVVLEHPARQGWKLADGVIPDETTVSFHRFRLTVDPKKTATLNVAEFHPVSTRWQINNLSDKEIGYFVDGKMLTPDVEQALRRVIAQKDELVGIDAEISSRRSQIDSISEDQKRLRENLKALKGSAEEKALVERYARELNTQEDRVLSLQKEMSDLRQKRDASQKTLSQIIESLQIETTM
jgi:uncharacterized protein YcfJ